MKNTRFTVTFFLALALGMLGVGQAVARGVSLSASQTLASVDCYNGGDCIQVTNGGITINGGGNYIDCHGVAGSVGMDVVGLSNVTIRNVEVRNCEIGIRISGGGNHTLNRVDVHD